LQVVITEYSHESQDLLITASASTYINRRRAKREIENSLDELISEKTDWTRTRPAVRQCQYTRAASSCCGHT